MMPQTSPLTSRLFRFAKAMGQICAVSFFVLTASVWGQDSDPPKKTDPPKKDAAQESAKADETQPGDKDPAALFETAFADWKASLKQLQAIQVRYQDARTDAAAAEVAKSWDTQMADAEAKLGLVRQAAVAAFAAAPNEDKELSQFLLTMLHDDYKADRYEEAYPIALAVTSQKGAANNDLLSMAGSICFSLNKFDEAADLFDRVRQHGGNFSELAGQQVVMVDEYKKHWEAEQAARKKDAESNLPRVLLKLERGEVEIELFENEAPGAVGNFIHLVEKKFYDGLTFHRVLEHFMAQGGCPEGTGTGGPGYEIYCECHQPNHRKHFRGTLSMAHAGRDTGGSQFFLTFVPTAHLNGKHTAFGRVVKGMEVLAKIRRRDPKSKTPPDRILSATVIRKDENKTYEPNRVR